jgi:hypothetical protein
MVNVVEMIILIIVVKIIMFCPISQRCLFRIVDGSKMSSNYENNHNQKRNSD